jgi:hypothetical protein
MISKQNHRVPRESADELTRSSWAKPITSYDDVPKVYKSFFEPFHADGQEFPYTVLTPSYERFIHRTTEKLICVWDHEIYILERSGNTFETQCYPFGQISCIEFRTILLDSYIKLSGITQHGDPGSATLKFNSVTDYLFTPILKKIRLATVDPGDTAQSSESEKFDYLVRSNYKFMNYAKRSLLGGEKVIHAILQPEIRSRAFTFLGMTYHRTISPAHMSILTDRELIIIREEARRIGAERYGGIWDYIPLNKIVTLSLSEKDNNLLSLSIRLPENACLEFLFLASAKQEINQLLDKFREWERDRLLEIK